MVVSSPKMKIDPKVTRNGKFQVLTVASRAYLATQRRLCVRKGTHWFKLQPTGRLTVDAVKNFFESCDDVASCIVSPPDSSGVRHVKVERS